MNIEITPLKDCFLIDVPKFGDDRGFFMESFNKAHFKEKTGIDFDIKQVNFASSSKDALRGLHYQDKPFAQAKLVGVTRGAVLDVVVDIRKDSPSYLQNFKAVLDDPNKMLYVPKGFAHGYKSLEDDTLFFYFVDEFYSPQNEKGVLYNDPTLDIDWELDKTPVVSSKDLKQPSLNHVQNNF
ncbi:MAG: dTDP-4-dehydrorhamnose 3,5-epimerase [Cyclobacteriaceae bacterium]